MILFMSGESKLCDAMYDRTIIYFFSNCSCNPQEVIQNLW